MPAATSHIHPTHPSRWVIRCAPLVPEGAQVLDLAAGGGRHARFLLERGAKLTCVDRDVSLLADLTGQAEIIAADLEDGQPWPLAGRQFDAVVVINYLFRPLFPALLDSVAPGGVLIYETYAAGNERYGRPRNPEHLLRPGELLNLVANRLQVVVYEAGTDYRPAGPRVLQRICAVAGDAPADLP